MARRTTVRLVDDLDGSEAAKTITFALDGVSYEIDLSETNADELGAALSQYIGAARRTGGRRAVGRTRPDSGSGSGSGSSRPSDSSAVRTWAASQGIDVSARGRIPASVQEQYDAAH